MSDSSSSDCKDSFLPQEGRPAQSGLFWSVSSQSDYIRQLLWRLDSLLLPFLHYGVSTSSSGSNSWASQPASQQAHRGWTHVQAQKATKKMCLKFVVDSAMKWGHFARCFMKLLIMSCHAFAEKVQECSKKKKSTTFFFFPKKVTLSKSVLAHLNAHTILYVGAIWRL